MKNVIAFLIGLSIPAITFAAINLYAPSPIEMSSPRSQQAAPSSYQTQQQSQSGASAYNQRRDASASY
jgi:hypothetical protein